MYCFMPKDLGEKTIYQKSKCQVVLVADEDKITPTQYSR